VLGQEQEVENISGSIDKPIEVSRSWEVGNDQVS
jgi:hypothetical protein